MKIQRILRVEPGKFKWGQIYQMITDKKFPDVGLEDLPLYANIKIFGIKKVATRPDLFSCAEVIGWIISQTNAATLVVKNMEKKFFASFEPHTLPNPASYQ